MVKATAAKVESRTEVGCLKVQCRADDLSDALKLARTCMPTNNRKPELLGVEISASGKWLNIRATDLEKMIVVGVAAKVQAEGTLMLPFRRLSQFLAAEHGTVNIVSGETKGKPSVQLSDSNGRVGIKFLNLNAPAKFPSPAQVIEPVHDIGKAFLTALARAIPFSADDGFCRPVLTGILVDSDGNGTVNVVSADGFRFFRQVIKQSLPLGQWLIPRETCKVLPCVFAGQETLKMGFSALLSPDSSLMVFEAGDVRLTTV